MATIRTHLIDASALVKLVVPEYKSEVVRNYFNNHSVFWTTSFCLAEAFGVLKAKHSRYRKIPKGLMAQIKVLLCGKHSTDDAISEETYLAAVEELVSMIRNETISIEEANIFHREIFDEVEQLSLDFGIDVVDTFQLVTMLRGFPSKMKNNSTAILITADKNLAKAARKKQLKVWNCIREEMPK